MNTWDPYYLRRGMRRLSSEYRQQVAQERDRKEQHRHKRDARIEGLDDAVEAAFTNVAETQRQEIARRLEEMQAANTEALIRNAEELEAVRTRLNAMLSQALVLPDGRRVFKTEDGTQVFDEHGQEVSPEVIDPASVPDRLPSWEEFETETAEHTRLEEERARLIERQQHLDEAETRLEDGELSEGDLDDLEAEFADKQVEAEIGSSLHLSAAEGSSAEAASSAGRPQPNIP
ncbi:MAG: hypothetical protein AAGI03_13855 [Pseudomonadota bacterium]